MQDTRQLDPTPILAGAAAVGFLGFVLTGGGVAGILTLAGAAMGGLGLAERQSTKARAMLAPAHQPQVLPFTAWVPTPDPTVNINFAPQMTQSVETTVMVSPATTIATPVTAVSTGRGNSLAQVSLTTTATAPVDVTEVIAGAYQNDPQFPGHLLLAAPSGSGKTTFLRAMIRRLVEGNELVAIFVSDPKGTAWPLPPANITRISHPTQPVIAPLVSQLKALVNILGQRIQAREATGQPTTDSRIIFIIDEWLLTLEKADQEGLRKDLVSLVKAIILTGREDKVHVWVVGQSHQAQDIGGKDVSTSIRQSLGIVCLGHGTGVDAIHKAIGDPYLVPTALRPQLQQSLAQCSTQTATPICYTNIGGHRVTPLPDLREFVQWSAADPDYEIPLD